jgi:hypothetical protein
MRERLERLDGDAFNPNGESKWGRLVSIRNSDPTEIQRHGINPLDPLHNKYEHRQHVGIVASEQMSTVPRRHISIPAYQHIGNLGRLSSSQ